VVIRYERDGDGIVAVAQVRVGLREVELAVPLGPWVGPEPEPSGLAGRPVVVVPDPSLVRLVTAGALRSGRDTPDVVHGADGIGARLLRSSAQLIVLVSDAGGAIDAARALGGRPLPALPFPDDHAIERFLAGCRVDADLAIPSLEPARSAARAVVLRLGLDAVHHVVEVDPRPGFEDAAGAETASVSALTAAAAGVLAGRVAAATRAWRLDP
jgi:hypothetical protein